LFTLLPRVSGQRIGLSDKDHDVQAESLCGVGWFVTDVSGQASVPCSSQYIQVGRPNPRRLADMLSNYVGDKPPYAA